MDQGSPSYGGGGSNPNSILGTIFIVLLLAGLGIVLLGLVRGDYVVVALGVLAVSVPVSAFVPILLGARDGGGSGGSDRLLAAMESINSRMLLSDQAKRIASRQKDRQAVREAIIEDIRLEAYDEALAMVNDMAALYGQHEDAEEFRQQILEAQAKKRTAMIDQAIKKIDQICSQHQWALARQEAARLQRMYPEYPGIGELMDRVELARERYKADLIREFKEAHDRQDTEHARGLLRRMDTELTPEEARPYMDLARDVLQSAKENLGVRFKMAMQDRDWITAQDVADQIIKEFPNSTYAAEVRPLLEKIHKNAMEQKQSAAR